MKITGITRDQHVFADYSYVLLVFMAPNLAGFIKNKEAAAICRAFSGAALAYSLLTDAKWGLLNSSRTGYMQGLMWQAV